PECELNSNPLSMEKALKKLSLTPYTLHLTPSRKIAVLGDMLELGDFSNNAHKEILDLAKKTADLIITIGSNFAKQRNSYQFKNNQQIVEFLLKEIHPNDIILIKGSRGMYMEEIVDKLAKY
ncbi:MAG: hypothetical protein M1338_03050, partial [Patescibacteria group bacterium]|nr:hypothetical protein [Patescibacteria group bacterium]